MATTTSSRDLSSRSSNPPRPPLILHVGVIGHRPNPKRSVPDIDALRRVIAAILQQIQAAVTGLAGARGELFASLSSGAPNTGIVRIVSSLAEGADQWVTDEAVRLGYELQVPMPFSAEEYAKDFAGPALSEFHRLKNQAKTILELDGCRARNTESYEAAGRIVIAQSDVMIALWDGQDGQGRGGTGQMVRESLRNGVPVIWIKWATPEQWQLLDTPQWRVLEDLDELKGQFSRLATLVTDILIPPSPGAVEDQLAPSNGRERYYREVQRRWNVLGCVWKLLRGVVLLKAPECTWRVRPYENITREGWDREWNKCPSLNRDLVDRIDKPYLAHYAWANQSALFYGDLHRSSTVLNYMLGTLAVLCALLGISSLVYSRRDIAAILAELASIGVIIFLTLQGAIRRWHERWIQYRILAERLRIARFLDLIGGARQDFTLPVHLRTYGNPANTWVYWHYRAVMRTVGLPGIRFDESRLAAVQTAWRDILIQAQIRYHQENALNLSSLDRRLHRLAIGLFGGTFAACAVHFGLAMLMDVPVRAGILLITLNALLPAFGAAVTAIRNQGEFHRIAQRSLAMSEELESLKLALSQIPLRSNGLRSQDMRRIMEQVARLMINETLDWRIVFQDRPLVLPA